MRPPFALNRIIMIEQQYAKRFTNVTQKTYGYLYWNEANKDCELSNHAIITDFIGVEATLKEICFFYRQKDIFPRLFPALLENELVELTPHLKQHGFELTMLNHAYYLWQNESKVESVHGIYFERILQINDEVKELIRAENYGEWTIKYLERHIKNPGYHLIGGFVGEQMVAMGSISVFEGYSRIDDLITFQFYRNKGFSGTLLNYLIQHNKENTDNHLYFYAQYPDAAPLYEKAGFVLLPSLKTWRAVKTC